MNECFTPLASFGDSGLATHLPVAGLMAVEGEFLALLDEKLRRRNERLIGRLLAWGELLDGAGWSVALSGVGGNFWFSERAKLDLQRLGGVPETWADLLAATAGMSRESVHQKSEGVIIWSGQAPAKDAPESAVGLTRREAEVMSWLREGKTGPEIAIILDCATRTVEKHLANLYRKLGVRNRAAVILNSSIPAN